jgi:hypothetical protein
MSIFGKRFGAPAAVPEWCHGLDADGYRRFRKLIRAELAPYARVTESDIDGGRVTPGPPFGTIGFSNLTAELAQTPPGAWRRCVGEWLTKLAASDI